MPGGGPSGGGNRLTASVSLPTPSSSQSEGARPNDVVSSFPCALNVQGFLTGLQKASEVCSSRYPWRTNLVQEDLVTDVVQGLVAAEVPSAQVAMQATLSC